jgi:hypothetical protein
VAFLAAALLQGDVGQEALRQACTAPRPTGVAPLDDGYRSRPFVFDAIDPSRPLASLRRMNMREPQVESTTIRLDDGTVGRLRAVSEPCTGAECQPEDCGCPSATDGFFVEVSGPDGRRIARWHLWAAYGIFQLVPVDLVGGPGDEIIAIRVPAHASPPIGFDIKVWTLTGSTVTELAPSDVFVERALATFPFACARWKDTLVVDGRSAKPRAIELRPAIGMSECCQVINPRDFGDADLQEKISFDSAHRVRTLRYDSATKKYVVN